MTDNILTESQYAILVRNQKLLSIRLNDIIITPVKYIINNPVIHPAEFPVFIIDTSILTLAREKDEGNSSNLRRALLKHMGYPQPLINGTNLIMDVRPPIAEEIVFLLWYEKMRSLGYRLLTEKAATELHDKNKSIFLRSWLESYHSSEYNRSRKIANAVRLVRPKQQIVHGYEHTSYCLESAYSRKEYKFSILASTHHDSTMQGLWLYKPSAWTKPRTGSDCESEGSDA